MNPPKNRRAALLSLRKGMTFRVRAAHAHPRRIQHAPETSDNAQVVRRTLSRLRNVSTPHTTMTTVSQRLRELGLSLPVTRPPLGSYVPYVEHAGLVFVSGQLCLEGGAPRYRGHLGGDCSVEDGKQAARLAALHVLAQLDQATSGNLDRVARCLRLGVFLQCTPDFEEHADVANGASELLVEVFGEAGRHARAAVGTASLPKGSVVEVEATFALLP